MGKNNFISLLKYIGIISFSALVLYNSVYFTKLDVHQEVVVKQLDPVSYAQKFWSGKFATALDNAIEINSFIKMLRENSQQTFDKYAHSQGIGDQYFFLVKGEAIVKKIGDEEVMLLLNSGEEEVPIFISTGVYFGNAVRDVTGLIHMGDFTNTMDFNSVSAELNKILQRSVILPFKSTVKMNTSVHFMGCIELNKAQKGVSRFELLPVSIHLNK